MSAGSFDDKILLDCITRVAGKRKIVGACLYGSRVAGYARPESDYDVILVLENYQYGVHYVYDKKSGLDISVLVVGRKSLERDAKSSFLGEFVVGRLLHICRPLINPEFFLQIESIYKKRVILEEISEIVKSTNILSTEILFPLEYIMFSKIKRRASSYPNAAYSYYRTYTGDSAKNNIEHSMAGYSRALQEIAGEDKELFHNYSGPQDILQISENHVQVKDTSASLKLPKRLRVLGSYVVHTYAGSHMLRQAVREAELKIRRHKAHSVRFPEFISCPRSAFWKLPEGSIIIDGNAGGDWLGKVTASAFGFSGYYISIKRRLGNIHSRTVLYAVSDKDGMKQKEIVVKEMSKSKSVKWAALNVWTSPVKRFKVDPMFRLGSAYKALRYVRDLGIQTPKIEAVVLDKKLLVTEFINGPTLADAIRQRYGKKTGYEAEPASPIQSAGQQVARIHDSGSSLGNIKPKNIIVSSSGGLYFTDLEQFQFKSGDNSWDLAQFISWGLKTTRSAETAAAFTKEFFDGYLSLHDNTVANDNIKRLARSKRYIESFYPVLVPSVAMTIKKEIKKLAG